MDREELMMRLLTALLIGIFILGISSAWAANEVTLLDVQTYGIFHAGCAHGLCGGSSRNGPHRHPAQCDLSIRFGS
jgi:hypothetical protein